MDTSSVAHDEAASLGTLKRCLSSIYTVKIIAVSRCISGLAVYATPILHENALDFLS